LFELLESALQLRRAFFDEFFEVALVIPIFKYQAAVFERSPHAQVQLVFLEGFQDVVISAAAHGFERSREVMHGRDYDDRNVRIVLAFPLKQAEAVHFRHHHIAQDQVRDVLFQVFTSEEAVAHCGAIVALGFEQGRNNLADRFFVVNYQDFGLYQGASQRKSYYGTGLNCARLRFANCFFWG
jgi:hypothetical protein